MGTVRNQMSRVANIALLCVVACGGAPSQANQPVLPPFVNVEFRQALIAPTKVDGKPWDGPGPIEPTATRLIATALATSAPYASVLAAFVNPAIAALDKPEPFGEARVMSGGVVLRQVSLETQQRDTLTPIWSGAIAYGVPLSAGTRIEVELLDRDLVENDPMGVATITYRDLVAALKAGTVFHVPVADQTNGQVLFLDVSVYPAP